MERGATSGVVAAALGHGSFAVTARHYVHPDTLANAKARKVSAALSESPRHPTCAPARLPGDLAQLGAAPGCPVPDQLAAAHRRQTGVAARCKTACKPRLGQPDQSRRAAPESLSCGVGAPANGFECPGVTASASCIASAATWALRIRALRRGLSSGRFPLACRYKLAELMAALYRRNPGPCCGVRRPMHRLPRAAHFRIHSRLYPLAHSRSSATRRDSLTPARGWGTHRGSGT